MADAGAN